MEVVAGVADLEAFFEEAASLVDSPVFTAGVAVIIGLACSAGGVFAGGGDVVPSSGSSVVFMLVSFSIVCFMGGTAVCETCSQSVLSFQRSRRSSGRRKCFGKQVKNIFHPEFDRSSPWECLPRLPHARSHRSVLRWDRRRGSWLGFPLSAGMNPSIEFRRCDVMCVVVGNFLPGLAHDLVGEPDG
jgi:hypothetical protein